MAGDLLLDFFDGDDEDGESVVPATVRRMLTDIFVKDALWSSLTAGFRGDDSRPDPASPLLSGRSRHDADLDITRVRAGLDLAKATASISRQESQL